MQMAFIKSAAISGQGSGFKIHLVQISRFTGSGFRVQGSRFMVQSSLATGFRVLPVEHTMIGWMVDGSACSPGHKYAVWCRVYQVERTTKHTDMKT